jgi:hypothetical protein
MSTLRSWILPLLLVANGVAALAIAVRAAELRRSWQIWEVRSEARAHLKYLTDEESHSTRSGRDAAKAHGAPMAPTEPQ